MRLRPGWACFAGWEVAASRKRGGLSWGIGACLIYDLNTRSVVGKGSKRALHNPFTQSPSSSTLYTHTLLINSYSTPLSFVNPPPLKSMRDICNYLCLHGEDNRVISTIITIANITIKYLLHTIYYILYSI